MIFADMTTNFSCLDPDLSRVNITEERWSLDADEDMTGVAVISSILVIFMVVGIPLNAVVLVALTYNKFWRNPSTFLLFNLSLVDFLTCILIKPFLVVPGLVGGVYNFGNSDYERCQVCQAGVIIVVWLIYTSIHILAIMSLDRLVYVIRPLDYEKWFRVHRLAIVIIAIWIICVVLAIPPLFGFGAIGFSKIIGTCTILISVQTRLGPSHLYLVFSVLEVLFPLGLMIASNIWLIYIVCKVIKNRFVKTYQQKRDATLSEVNKQTKKKYIAQQIQVLKVFGSIFAFYFCTWIPVLVIEFFVIVTIGLDRVKPAAFGVVYLCFLVQSVIHPMLESLLSMRVRNLAKKIFYTCYSCKKACHHDAYPK